jgi:hypothetical protein
MKNKKYDVVIKSHQKDYFKLNLVVDSIKYLNPQPSKIYILSKDGYVPKGTDYSSIINPVMDSDVVPYIDRSKLNHRPNWNWINLVSLFQTFTEQDLYFDIQSDNFFLKNIDLFDDLGKPKIFRSTANHVNVYGWRPYFNFSETVFNLPKMSAGFSYIIEFLMYDKNHLKKLTEMYDSFESMMQVIYSNINSDSYPADQEIFGNLAEKYFSNEYCFVDNFPVHFSGKEVAIHGEPTIEDVMYYIENVGKGYPFGSGATENLSACSFHTWI